MIASPQMLHKSPHVRRVVAVGRILSASTVAWMRDTAAGLRNKSQEAAVGGDRNAAQVALSEAELLEDTVRTNGIPVEALFLAHGSEWI